jgi:MFS family permease
MESGMKQLIEPLRSASFSRVWAGQLMNVLGDGVYSVAIALFLLPRKNAPETLGLVLGLSALGSVISLLIGGVLADRHRRSRVIAASDVLRAAGLALILVKGPDSPLPVLLGGALMMGLGSGLYRPAYGALLPSLVPKEQVRAVNALRSFTNRAGVILGAAAGGVLAAAVSPRAALILDLVTFGISVLTVLGLKESTPSRKGREGWLQEVSAGFRYVRGSRWMVAVMLQGTVQLALVIAPVTVLLPFVLGKEGGWLGTAISAEAVGALAGSAVGGMLQTQRPGAVSLIALLASAAQTLALALGAPAWVYVPASFVAGFGLSVMAVLWTSALQLQTPREQLGKVLALDALANSALLPVGLALTGWLLPRLGQVGLAWAATIALVASLLAISPVPGVLSFGAGSTDHGAERKNERRTIIGSRKGRRLVSRMR